MGKLFEGIGDPLRAWLLEQPMFFVATAPSSHDGHLNVSPKGIDGTFAVVDDHRVAYLDLTGSGIETVAHLRDDGRIVLMFCAFSGPPRIVRLHGRGVASRVDSGHGDQASWFPSPWPVGARTVVTVDVTRISDSCGFGVPLMNYVGQRDVLTKWAAKKTPEGLAEYQSTRNASSIDDLPGLRMA